MQVCTVDGGKVRALRLKAGLTQGDLGNLAGVVGSYISAIEVGKRDNIPIGTLSRLADALGVSVQALLVGSDTANDTRATEVQMVKVPLLGKVPGGVPQLIEAHATGEAVVVASLNVAGVRRAYALDVVGESMIPRLRSGDVVIVDPDALWKPNDVVVALVGPETTVKRIVLIDGRPMLVADNGHGIIDPAGQDVRVIGVIVWVQPQGWKP